MNQITEKELISLLEDGKLCDYCPYMKNSDCHSIGGLCEGSFCEDAKDNYVEENNLEMINE